MRHTQLVQRVRQILEQEYTTPITLEQLSKEVALSPYYLIRLFYRAHKQTPRQYLVQLRINRAKELLISSDLSITHICALVGYESLGSFSTLFYRTVGLSPRAYRASSRSIRKSSYIPLCSCVLHGIHDAPES